MQQLMSVVSGSSEVSTHLFMHRSGCSVCKLCEWQRSVCAQDTLYSAHLVILASRPCGGGGGGGFPNIVPCNLTPHDTQCMRVFSSGRASMCVCEWSLSLLAQMPRLNPSPAVLHSGAKLEHLAPS